MAGTVTRDVRSLVVRPWFVVSLATLIVNDWVLKPTFGNALTGKLSDFAGLSLVAFVLSDRSLFSRRRWPAGALAVGLSLFVATKLDGRAATGTEAVLDAVLPWSNVITQDPTDVLALVIVPLAWWAGQQTKDMMSCSAPWSIPEVRWPLGIAALLACAASGYTDTEHWLLVDNAGEILVYETLYGADSVYGAEHFDANNVSEDGSWLGQSSQRSPIRIETLTLEGVSCRRSDPSHCVKESDSLSILETFDGGENWATIWAIDPNSKYASQRWLDSQIHYVDQEVGIRQLVIADDGMVVAILAPDLFVSRSPAGDWSLGESWFRQIPRGVIVQLLGGFGVLSLLSAISLRIIPNLDWPLRSMTFVIAALVALGQVRILGPVAVAILGCIALVLVLAALLVDLEERHKRAKVLLRCVLIPIVPAVVGVVLIKTWSDGGGSLDTRRMFHIAMVLCAWALGVVVRGRDRLDPTSASEPGTS